MSTPRLNQDNEMIERMELDLVAKAKEAFFTANLEALIHGVFSLDELEELTETSLCQKLAVGVGYAGAESASDPKGSLNSGPGGNTTKMVDFLFHVILAVEHGKECVERYSATKLLTVLRRGIQGKICSGDQTNRTWAFVKEFPNVTDSTDTMLYYSQVWLLRLPSVA